MKALRAIGVFLSSSAALLACASIAGIQDAELDRDLCTLYCDTVMANCRGAFAVYENHRICLEICGTLEPGEIGDDSGNTVACRLHQAEVIAEGEEEATQCPAAGPGGNGRCGKNCESFCVLNRAICDPEIAEEDCLEECEALDDSGDFDISQQMGDNVQCRLYHVSLATVDARTHCPHAAGLALCVP